MTKDAENCGFICISCGADVQPLTNGSYRNHCPVCLSSVHVDILPGDRASGCRGVMRAAGLAHKGGKGWQIVHRCERCGTRRSNKIAANTSRPMILNALARLNQAQQSR